MSLLTRRVVSGHGKTVIAERKAMTAQVINRHNELNRGDKGRAVKGLQEHLQAAGAYHGKLTGTFDARTELAVKSLQKQTGLAATGIVDRATLGKVKDIDLFVKDGFVPPAKVGQRGRDIGGVEKKLEKLKLKPGKVDGIFSKATAKAVRGFQRKHKLAATGQVNHRTSKAIDKAIKTEGQSAFANKVLDIARSKLGFHERGDNGNPFSKYFGRPAEAWCADFVSYCYTKAGKKLNEPYTPTLLSKLHNNGAYHRQNPKPGDIIVFDWHPGSGVSAEHTGLVEKVFKRNGRQYVQTIEGNSADMVRRRVWPVGSNQIAGFGSVK